MLSANKSADQRSATPADRNPASRKAAAGRLVWTVLLVLTVAELLPLGLLPAQSLSTGSQRPALEPTLRPAAAADIPFTGYDSAAEGMLLQLANQARSEVGVPALKLDSGLSQAARAHAEAMLAAGQLSHQLEGESALLQRLAAAARIQLDEEAENVAFDIDAADGHHHLMLSAPHRANLLNAAYNVVGIGVVHSENELYIVQDFGHALPTYSAAEFKDQVSAAVALARRQARQPGLARQNLPEADDAACSMAKADTLGTSLVHQISQRYTLLTYTTLHPEVLPSNAGQAFSMRGLKSFSVGACYARTETYPTGVYWVVVAAN
jgi:uncharacterized protein YkwD